MARMGQEKLFEFPQVRGDVGAEAADPKSRAPETDARGLNRRVPRCMGFIAQFY